MDKSLFFIFLLILFSCSENKCKMDDIRLQLQDLHFNQEEASFSIQKEKGEWQIIFQDSVNEIFETRFAYQVNFFPLEDIILLNHLKTDANSLNSVLKKAHIDLYNRFEMKNLEKTPNVGFQIDKSNLNIEDIIELTCLLNKAVESLKYDLIKENNVKKKKSDKLLNKRYSFFQFD